ncbi:uncharacterized protein LOC141587429 [Silene latifolia]|uniref:uncharacterized protein LOC141587429 n=1 Tax=Silene latifolia TaxID=37657 RepID=UPI003D771722
MSTVCMSRVRVRPFISKSTALSPNFSTLNLIPTTSFRFPTPTSNPVHHNVRLIHKPLASASVAPVSVSVSVPQPETLKTRLGNGETLYGLFLCSFSPTLAEIAGHAGYDFVVIDMEHGFGGIPEALDCLRALSATSTPAIIRLPESTETWAKKALDLGPQGIMFPMIQSHKDARKAVSYCRYPPDGVRGAAHPIVRASGYGVHAASYLGSCHEDLLIMCQVESLHAADKVDEIAAVDGVDCIQMGPLDLSASMGYLWDPANKKVRQTLHKVEKAVLKSSKPGKSGGPYLCGFAMPHDTPQDLRSRGYHMISGAVDVAMFRSAAVEDVTNFKLSLETGLPDSDAKDGDEKYWSE